MFTFIGDHFLFLVCASFALFMVTLIWVTIQDAMLPKDHGRS